MRNQVTIIEWIPIFGKIFEFKSFFFPISKYLADIFILADYESIYPIRKKRDKNI